MNENIFRILAALIFFTGIGISSYFRRKADRESGEKISRAVDGSVMMTIIKIGGLILWLPMEMMSVIIAGIVFVMWFVQEEKQSAAQAVAELARRRRATKAGWRTN